MHSVQSIFTVFFFVSVKLLFFYYRVHYYSFHFFLSSYNSISVVVETIYSFCFALYWQQMRTKRRISMSSVYYHRSLAIALINDASEADSFPCFFLYSVFVFLQTFSTPFDRYHIVYSFFCFVSFAYFFFLPIFLHSC